MPAGHSLWMRLGGAGIPLRRIRVCAPWLAAASPPRAIAIATRGGRCGGDLLGGPAQQPAESFLGEDLRDAGAVERGSFGGQPCGDLGAGDLTSAGARGISSAMIRRHRAPPP